MLMIIKIPTSSANEVVCANGKVYMLTLSDGFPYLMSDDKDFNGAAPSGPYYGMRYGWRGGSGGSMCEFIFDARTDKIGMKFLKIQKAFKEK